MAVKTSLVPFGSRMSMLQPRTVDTTALYRRVRCCKRSSAVRVSSGEPFHWRKRQGRKVTVLPIDVVPCIGCDARLNVLVAIALLLVFQSRIQEVFSAFEWGQVDDEEDTKDHHGEQEDSTSRRNNTDRSIPSSAEGVWEHAWRPLRDPEHDENDADNSSDTQMPLTWVNTVADDELPRLLTVCMSQVEENIRGMGAMGVEKRADEVVEGLLWRAAAASSSLWLGYVPGLIHSEKAFRKARQDGGYQIIGFEKKVGMYYSVLRLMTSTGFDVSQGNTLERNNDDTTSLIESSLSLRSWQLTPRKADTATSITNKADSTWQEEAQQGETSVGSELLCVAPAVLQDMAVIVADIVCAAYIGDVVNGSPSCIPDSPKNEESAQYPVVLLEMSLWPSLLDSRMASTRDIQNFTNSLYFHRFLDEYIYQISAIYEDRLPVFMLQATGNSVPRVCTANIQMRRATELAQLTGVKYAISLAIEGIDFFRPMLHRAMDWLQTCLSWVLRSLIGKAIGMVIEGIQQSSSRQRKKSRSKRNDINIVKPA